MQPHVSVPQKFVTENILETYLEPNRASMMELFYEYS